MGCTTQLAGLHDALAAEYRDLIAPYRAIDPVAHHSYVEHILGGGVLHLHRYELDSVPLTRERHDAFTRAAETNFG